MFVSLEELDNFCPTLSQHLKSENQTGLSVTFIDKFHKQKAIF